MAVAARVTVTTTATVLVAADEGEGSKPVNVRNRDASVAVYLGGADVTSSTGYQLDAGEAVGMVVESGHPLYGITGSGSAVCHVLRANP